MLGSPVHYKSIYLEKTLMHCPEMKITLFEYVRLYRILMASLALCEPGKAITQIGLDCGYASLSSFYRDFNMVYGVPPKFFREKFSVTA